MSLLRYDEVWMEYGEGSSDISSRRSRQADRARRTCFAWPSKELNLADKRRSRYSMWAGGDWEGPCDDPKAKTEAEHYTSNHRSYSLMGKRRNQASVSTSKL